MQQTLTRLTRDHRQIEIHLVSLEELSTHTDVYSLDMLNGVLNTLNSLQYDQVQEHHELEDKVLDQLKSRFRISDIMISTIERDHARLDFTAANTAAIVQQSLNEISERSTQKVKHGLLEFAQAYRNHIRTEEDVIFPMIEQLIAEQAIDSEGKWTAQSA